MHGRAASLILQMNFIKHFLAPNACHVLSFFGHILTDCTTIVGLNAKTVLSGRLKTLVKHVVRKTKMALPWGGAVNLHQFGGVCCLVPGATKSQGGSTPSSSSTHSKLECPRLNHKTAKAVAVSTTDLEANLVFGQRSHILLFRDSAAF